MKHLLVNIYSVLPNSVKRLLIGNVLFKHLVRPVLMQKETYRETFTWVKRSYEGYPVKFKFFAAFKDVIKAKNKGVENTLLNKSIQLIKELKPNYNGLVILDIGANFGYLSMVWAQTIAKRGMVYAFEPNARVYSSFRKSVDANNLDAIIKVENQAVGRSNGKVALYINNTTSNVKANVLNVDEELPLSTNIAMTSIDSFLKSKTLLACDLIKIDVDGIELDILKGSIKTIETLRPIFIVETNNNSEIIDFFTEKNYKVLDMALKMFSSGVLPPNVFCVPN